jgi:hypothetical protein
MNEKEKNLLEDDDFWNLDAFAKKKAISPKKQFSKSATSAVEIEVNTTSQKEDKVISDSKLSSTQEEYTNSTITRFIPPHKDPVFAKKNILLEYAPANPLIKSVKICGDKPDDRVFVENNLFIRERRALLDRKAKECSHASYYSYSPRYSQMSRAQLNWYLWWRENTRNGIFLKTDESYIILYAYELASTGDGEDKQASLDMLCALLCNYSEKDINIVFRMMIRDLICDFCLIHSLPAPIQKLDIIDKKLLANAFLPEFFFDLSERNIISTLNLDLSSLSVYDYRRSRYYTDDKKELFDKAISEAVGAVFNDEEAFKAITSFTSGLYGCVTVERKPFARMINIVNRSVKMEITYYQISGLQVPITDAIRYAENRLREHLGIKNKLHIMSINPGIKSALDVYFDKFYPAAPVVDRRKKIAVEKAEESHDYDRFYDVPKAEISPERAIEIERESWSTTKILTEAFNDPITDETQAPNAPELIIEPIVTKEPAQINIDVEPISTDISNFENNSGLFAQIKAEIGEIADFITLCKSPIPTEQRKFASSHTLTIDEIADRINECAANVFGDIILEDTGGSYAIIEDYIDQL